MNEAVDGYYAYIALETGGADPVEGIAIATADNPKVGPPGGFRLAEVDLPAALDRRPQFNSTVLRDDVDTQTTFSYLCLRP